MILFFRIGIIELIWTAVFNSYIAYFINSYFSAELLSYSTKEQIKDIIPIFIVSMLMGSLVYFSGPMLPDNNLVKIIAQIFIGVVTYIGISGIVKIEELKTVYDLIGSVFKKGKFAKHMPFN